MDAVNTENSDITDILFDDERYHKETFEKIPKVKQERILQAAISEFAKNGYNAANINTIAKRADISIGSLYNYFSSKEDLFLTIINYGYKVLENVIYSIDLRGGDIYDKIERLFIAAQEYARKYPQLNQIYLDMSTEGLSHLSKRLSGKLETITARFYRGLINSAKKKGIVADDVDEYITSFCIDNLIMFIQYSYTSKYFIERMKIFVGDHNFNNDDVIIKGVMQFVRRALQPR